MFFLYDENGELYGFVKDEKKYFYIKDITGTIYGIVDESGMLVGKYEYSAYGKCTILLDTDKIATINPFRFKCYYYDRESGMYYCHTRYFVPEWGRWLNADHFAYLEFYNINVMNLFVYCGNNPIMYTDIDGYSWNSFWKGVGDWFKGAGNSIKGFFVDDVYGKFLVPIGEGISSTASKVWNEGLVPAWEMVSNFFTHDIPDFFVNTIYKEGLKPAWEMVSNFFAHDIPDFFVNTIYKEGLKPAWDWLKGDKWYQIITKNFFVSSICTLATMAIAGPAGGGVGFLVSFVVSNIWDFLSQGFNA